MIYRHNNEKITLAPVGELHVRFHTAHMANGQIGLMAMDSVESPLRRFASYSLPLARSSVQTITGGPESLAVLLVVEASTSDSTVVVRATTEDNGSKLASLRLCRAEFFGKEPLRVGAVSLRIEGDPACVDSEHGPTARGTHKNVVVSLHHFSATQVQI